MNGRGVLLVDDDPLSQAWLQAWLEQHGWAVTIAGTVAEAERLLREQAFACLLVDRRLPDGDGIAWLRGRGASAARNWILSGDHIGPDALPPGTGYLRKPVDGERLLREMGADTSTPASAERIGAADLKDLDDAMALRALAGNASAVASLRKMLRAQLVSGHAWAAALGDAEARRTSLNEVHKLRAGAAMTGCARLAAVCERIERELRGGGVPDAEMRAEFEDAVSALLVLL